jgi:hypothetical protein
VSIPKLLKAKSTIALQNAMIWNILVSVVEKNYQIEKVQRYRAIAKPVECRMLTFYSKQFVSYGDKWRYIVFFGIQYLKSACLGRISNIPKSPKSLLITVSTGPPRHINSCRNKHKLWSCYSAPLKCYKLLLSRFWFFRHEMMM